MANYIDFTLECNGMALAFGKSDPERKESSV